MHDDFYQMYLEEMKAITPCTQEENTQLLNDAAAGNEGAKKRLIEGNLEAALTCAKAYDGKGVLLTDLAARVNVLQTVSQALARELGREAAVEELADKMKMTVDEVKDIMKMAMDAMSMNAENADLEELAEVEGIEITEAAEDEEE